jgi:hypothetical protein
MDREVAEARSGPELQGMSNAQSFVLAYSGHLEAARKMSRQAADFAHQAGGKEAEAQYEIDAAQREALFGNLAEARQSAKAGLNLSKSRDVEAGAAFALALSGDSSRSQALTALPGGYEGQIFVPPHAPCAQRLTAEHAREGS